MMIFKLLLLIAFILVVLVIFWLTKKAFKVADALAVDERKNDIKSDADLVDEVAGFQNECPEKIEKANSRTIKDFI